MDENGIAKTTPAADGTMKAPEQGVMKEPDHPMANILQMRDEQKLPALVPAAKFDLSPSSLAEAMALAEMMAKSTIIPKDYQGNPGNVLIAIQWGMELGLKALQAMQNIAVINGRPSLWGDAVLAIVRASTDGGGNRLLEGISETFDDATNTATCEVKRRGAALPCVRKFSHADAQKANLLGKDVWKAYEKRMLQMRARSWALRDEFTDVIKGMPVAEEVMDYTNPPEKDVTPLPTAAPVQSKADRLKEGLKAKEAPKQAEPPFAVTLQEVLHALTSADTKEKLAEAADLARGLTREEDQKLANTAYKKVKAKLFGEPPVTETLESGGAASATIAP
jgi:hypothetical protein